MRVTWGNDDGGVSAKTAGKVPSTWPSFVLGPAEEAPEVTAHQIESLDGKVLVTALTSGMSDPSARRSSGLSGLAGPA